MKPEKSLNKIRIIFFFSALQIVGLIIFFNSVGFAQESSNPEKNNKITKSAEALIKQESLHNHFEIFLSDDHKRYSLFYLEYGQNLAPQEKLRIEWLLRAGTKSKDFDRFPGEEGGEFVYLEQGIIRKNFFSGLLELGLGRDRNPYLLHYFFQPAIYRPELYSGYNRFQPYWTYTGAYLVLQPLHSFHFKSALYLDLEYEKSPRPEFATVLWQNSLSELGDKQGFHIDANTSFSASGFNILQNKEDVDPDTELILEGPEKNTDLFEKMENQYRIDAGFAIKYQSWWSLAFSYGQVLNDQNINKLFHTLIRLSYPGMEYSFYLLEYQHEENEKQGHLYTELRMANKIFYLSLFAEKNFSTQEALLTGFQAGAKLTIQP